MIRTGRYTTFLLVVIVLILLFGVGIAVYYVLDLDWFKRQEVNPYTEQVQVRPYIENITPKQEYDMSKRIYDISLDTNDFEIIVYKDGTVGITMNSNEENDVVSIYDEIIKKEIIVDVTNIVKAYEVEASKGNNWAKYVLLLDKEGHLYKLSNSQLANNGKYVFNKIEGVAKIVDVRQITNTGLTENENGINVIAIDNENNEILLTNYLANN